MIILELFIKNKFFFKFKINHLKIFKNYLILNFYPVRIL
jgi:hypothetical protein